MGKTKGRFLVCPDVLVKFRSYFRSHNFDLENPETIKTGVLTASGEITYPKSKCLKCGETLCLDLWQMKTLPRSMKYGCRGI